MRRLNMVYILNLLSVVILLGIFITTDKFDKTKVDIKEINFKTTVNNTKSLSKNIIKMITDKIGENFYTKLYKDVKLRKALEKDLKYFLTENYKHIYIIDKPKGKNNLRVLLDSSLESKKFHFGELYRSKNIQKYIDVIKDKKTIYLKNGDKNPLSIIFISPVIVNNKVEALCVIDFSTKEHEAINRSLNELDETYEKTITLFVIVFLIILFVSYREYKSKKEKERLYKELVEKEREVSSHLKELDKLNKTLEDRIKEEVKKNRDKDKQILQQSRLAQMGEMISMIAHQWRQPLSAISATSSSLMLKAKLNKLDKDSLIEHLSKISEYSQHLSSTIDDFRDFFKPNKNKKETTYTQIVESVLNIVEPSLSNKNIKILKDLKSNIVLKTYPNELKQVLLNFIKNAEDILIDKKTQNPTITIQTQDNILRVKDNAGGIPDDIIDKIFEPYFSTKLKKDGTGLGLYMSKVIIEEHCKGKLIAYNDENGAVFEVIL